MTLIQKNKKVKLPDVKLLPDLLFQRLSKFLLSGSAFFFPLWVWDVAVF